MTVRATRRRRELALACVLTGGGAVLVLLASAGSPDTEAGPVGRAAGLVALAGVVALLAARGWARLAVGLVLTIVGVGLTGFAIARLAGDGPVLRSGLIAVGAVLVAVAGGICIVRGRSWPALGARYDAPGRRPVTAGDAWDALDRGEDPTAR